MVISGKTDELQTEVRESIEAAYTHGTWMNLKTQWKAFLLFTLYYGLQSLPASLNTILIFMQFLSRSFKSISSIINYVQGVRTLHYLNNFKFPELSKSFEYKMLIRGLRRLKPHTPRRALPITPHILLTILTTIDFHSSKESTFWCLLLTLIFSFSRVGNILPKSQQKFDHKKHLVYKDITSTEHGLIILLKHSKTNQFAQRCHLIPIAKQPDSPIDLVTAFTHMKTFLHNTQPNTTAFTYKVNNKNHFFTTHTFVKLLREKLDTCGYNSRLYAGHSTRRGAATWSFQANVQSELVKHQGQWASLCYMQYLEFSMHQKLSVTQKMFDSIKM